MIGGFLAAQAGAVAPEARSGSWPTVRHGANYFTPTIWSTGCRAIMGIVILWTLRRQSHFLLMRL
ncbi:MAG: hypothetical protein R3A10_23410 [Caldilineaceae bacterium]